MEHDHIWIHDLDPREIAQVQHALAYADEFSSAGVPGHSQFMLIAKLAGLLDAWSAPDTTPPQQEARS